MTILVPFKAAQVFLRMALFIGLLQPLEDLFMHNHRLCDQLRITISVSARTTSKRTSLNSKRHVSLVFCVSLFHNSQR